MRLAVKTGCMYRNCTSTRLKELYLIQNNTKLYISPNYHRLMFEKLVNLNSLAMARSLIQRALLYVWYLDCVNSLINTDKSESVQYGVDVVRWL